MKKRLIIGAGAAVVAVAGYFIYSQFGADLSRYANINIDLGATPAVQSCDASADYARLLCLTEALKSGLDPALLAVLERPYTLAEAQKWSNFPPMGFPDRIGLTLGDFTPEQRGVIKAILQTATGLTGNEGYDELEQVLNADDYLLAQTGETGFSSSNYHIAFLGTPAATGTWQLYFGGHHFALTNTYHDGALIGATPSFRGVEPFVAFDQNGRHNAPMLQELAAFAAALTALTPEQQAKARLATAFTDIVAGPQKDDAIPTTPEGLRLSDTSPATQALVLAAIETYVGDMNAANAPDILNRYGAEIGDTYIAFAGTPGMTTENDYIRIDGPSVWIELSMQPGRSIDGIHPHSVGRDKTNDYGGSAQ